MTATSPPITSDVGDVATELGRHDLATQVGLLERQPPPVRPEIYRRLGPRHQALLLEHIPTAWSADFLRALPPDERARLLTEVPASEHDGFLALLPQPERVVTEKLLRYPKESVGRLMTPRVLELDARLTRNQAMDLVRSADLDVDTVYTLPVTDWDNRLVGVVRLRDLVVARDAATVSEVMRPPEPTLSPDQDQEEAAQLVLSESQLAVPVVEDDRLLGLVTMDDAMAVLAAEATEDAARSAGVEPIAQPYFSAPLFRIARLRGMWLLVLAAAATFTVSVLELFEAELEEVVALALFIPLLMGTGGNAGAQATTTLVRAMAVGNVRFGDLPRVMWREVRVGFILGGLLATLALGLVWGIYDQRLAVTVAITLLSVCTLATLAGATFPVIAAKVGLDPAVVSAPFIATFVDATGLLIYFSFAKAIFQI